VNNRKANGEPFSIEEIEKAWEKAQIIEGQDPKKVRRDLCGAIIHREMFGHTSDRLSHGWEIDHIKPVAKGGTDDYLNLQPLQWENNRHKGDAHPSWICAVLGGKELNRYVG
jgi:hypothetical protein